MSTGILKKQAGVETARFQKAPRKDLTMVKKQQSSLKKKEVISSRRKSKPKKKSPGVKALMEIRQYQKSTGFLIPRAPFNQLVRELIQKVVNRPLRLTDGASLALRCAAEDFQCRLFDDANLLAIHAGRVTVYPKDLRLALRIGGHLDLLDYDPVVPVVTKPQKPPSVVKPKSVAPPSTSKGPHISTTPYPEPSAPPKASSARPIFVPGKMPIAKLSIPKLTKSQLAKSTTVKSSQKIRTKDNIRKPNYLTQSRSASDVQHQLFGITPEETAQAVQSIQVDTPIPDTPKPDRVHYQVELNQEENQVVHDGYYTPPADDSDVDALNPSITLTTTAVPIDQLMKTYDVDPDSSVVPVELFSATPKLVDPCTGYLK